MTNTKWIKQTYPGRHNKIQQLYHSSEYWYQQNMPQPYPIIKFLQSTSSQRQLNTHAPGHYHTIE